MNTRKTKEANEMSQKNAPKRGQRDLTAEEKEYKARIENEDKGQRVLAPGEYEKLVKAGKVILPGSPKTGSKKK